MESQFKVLAKNEKTGMALVKCPFNEYTIVPIRECNDEEMLDYLWANGVCINTDACMTLLFNAQIIK